MPGTLSRIGLFLFYMANFKNVPAITQKYHIEVPLNEYYSGYCVYIAHFGDRFFIGKGKALMQSIQSMATIIERGLRLRNYDKTDLYYHIITHIVKNSILRGTVEVVGGENLSEFELLKLEQETLNKYKNNTKCLNNNFDVYIPQWIPELEVQKFMQWKGISKDKLVKSLEYKKRNDLFRIDYFNELDKNKRGVYKLFFGDCYYIGRAKLLSQRMLTHKKEIKKRLLGITPVVETDFYRKMIECISKNNLKTATCVLLKECISVDELMSAEQVALNKGKRSKKCLNIGFVAKKSSREFDDTVEDTIRNKPVSFVKDGKRFWIKPYQKKGVRV